MQYDFNSVLTRLKKRLLQKLDGKNLLFFSTNSALLEIVAEEFDNFAMYSEYLLRENIWDTARNTSSIMKQIDYYGYRPHRKIGASGFVEFSTSENFSRSYSVGILIPKWTKISGGGLTFVTTTPNIYFPANQPSIKAPVAQGYPQIFSTTIKQAAFPEGTNYLKINVLDSDIENNIYDVYVNGFKWDAVSNLRQVADQPEPGKTKVYVIKTLPNFKGITLFFGNNELGKALQYGDTVEFIYLKTSGSKGNILSSQVINKVESDIFTEFNIKINLFCRNLEALTGGKDYESLDNIKAFAPLSFQTAHKAITKLDYETIIKQTGIADVVQVWGEKEINEDRGNPPGTYLPTSENVVYITGYKIDPQTGLGLFLTEFDKEKIMDELNSKKGVTDILQFVTTEILYITFKSTVFVTNLVYTADQVKGFVHDSLVKEFGLEKGKFKKSLYFSDYIAAIDNTTGVNHCVCSILITRLTTFDFAYGFNINLNINNIEPGSILIKVKDTSELEADWKVIAEDSPVNDEIGNFVGMQINPEESSDTYELPGVLVNYINGSIGDISILGLTELYYNYQVRIDFKLKDSEGGNLVLNLREQIFAWYADETDTIVTVS